MFWYELDLVTPICKKLWNVLLKYLCVNNALLFSCDVENWIYIYVCSQVKKCTPSCVFFFSQVGLQYSRSVYKFRYNYHFHFVCKDCLIVYLCIWGLPDLLPLYFRITWFFYLCILGLPDFFTFVFKDCLWYQCWILYLFTPVEIFRLVHSSHKRCFHILS